MASHTLEQDKLWITRCFDLARRGIGRASPNPPVGAVLVHDNRILGEGYHQFFGGPHAEVNAINNVASNDRHLISSGTLYVSLEPCCITRKTGPCTDLIIREGIKDVRISVVDPNPSVSGKGLEKLKSNGIHVVEGILREEGENLIRPFTTNILLQRPYILLKWVQSKFGYSGVAQQQIWFSEPTTKTWSHGQRATVDAIMVGARTVATDNPALTTRDFPGKSPQRVIYDPNGKLNASYKVFHDDGCVVHYYSLVPNPAIKSQHIRQHLLRDLDSAPQEIMQDLFEQQMGIVLIEGGPYLQKQFIRQNLWDEAWVIQTKHPLDHGLESPNVHGELIQKLGAGKETVLGIRNKRKAETG